MQREVFGSVPHYTDIVSVPAWGMMMDEKDKGIGKQFVPVLWTHNAYS